MDDLPLGWVPQLLFQIRFQPSDSKVGDVGVTHDLANVGELLLCRNQPTPSCHDAHCLCIDETSVDARLSAIQGLGEVDRDIVQLHGD